MDLARLILFLRTVQPEAGVALALIEPLPKTALSGAAWRLSPRKAVIQLTARHKTDDHLWFSFFHEAAQILLQSKLVIFVDDANGVDAKIELEANDWASNAHVPTRTWQSFVSASPRSEHAVREFAERQSIAPGIVVGMLRHEGVVKWSHQNDLKVRLAWTSQLLQPAWQSSETVSHVLQLCFATWEAASAALPPSRKQAASQVLSAILVRAGGR